jgi:protein-S-isoprenylcysteine O-methyltransferase Ste14
LLLHVPVPWVFVLTYLIGVGLEHIRPLALSIDWRHLTGVGDAVFVVGFALAGWGWLTFRTAGTTTVPGQTSSQMVTWGPYRFTRNPMYVGLSVAYLGEAGILHHVWPVLLLPLTLVYVNRVVIPLEEAKLTEAFGEQYELYCGKVRRWF